VTPELVVVDASVVVTVLIDPGAAGEAIAARLAATRPYAPNHLPVEVANVLRRRRNAGALGETEALLALDGFASLAVELWPFEVVSARAWQLGANLSAYDAAYVALAERLDAPLLTADARLPRAPGPRCPIEVFAQP
jgi:predicted nucleic acid-binding protein